MKLFTLSIKFFIAIILLANVLCNNAENKNSLKEKSLANSEEKNNLNHGKFNQKKFLN
jgi:hypothetical protein